MSKTIAEILAPKPEARPRIYAYSIADIALGAGVPALLPLGMDFAPYPALRRWLAALRQRPAWRDEIFLADLRAGNLA